MTFTNESERRISEGVTRAQQIVYPSQFRRSNRSRYGRRTTPMNVEGTAAENISTGATGTVNVPGADPIENVKNVGPDVSQDDDVLVTFVRVQEETTLQPRIIPLTTQTSESEGLVIGWGLVNGGSVTSSTATLKPIVFPATGGHGEGVISRNGTSGFKNNTDDDIYVVKHAIGIATWDPPPQATITVQISTEANYVRGLQTSVQESANWNFLNGEELTGQQGFGLSAHAGASSVTINVSTYVVWAYTAP